MRQKFFACLFGFIFSLLLSQKLQGEDIPSFGYVDIELFSATLSEGYPLTSGIYVDWYPGTVLIHLGFLGSYGTASFYGLEGGIGLPLSASFQKNVPTSYISNVWTTYSYNYKITHYEVSKTRADRIKLTLLDLGVKKVFDFYYYEGYPDEKELFGKTYSDMSEYEIYADDMIFYGGIKIMHVLNSALTLDEFVFYIHALLGIADRRANIWTGFNDPSYTPKEEGKIVPGGELGIRYNMTLFRLGVYNNAFYFNAGFRIPFSLGF